MRCQTNTNTKILIGLCLTTFFLTSFCLTLRLVNKPIKKGFFCSDITLRLPYKQSTIPEWVLILVTQTSAIILIFTIVERRNYKRYVILYLVGLSLNQFITDTTKYFTGRLRPNFIQTCNPDITLNKENCGSFENQIYVNNYTCIGNKFIDKSENQKMMQEMRLSFVSGHASLSTYWMVFCAKITENRISRRWNMIPILVKMICMLFTLLTCITRINDNMHHCLDVIFGCIVGIVSALTIYKIENELDRYAITSVETNENN